MRTVIGFCLDESGSMDEGGKRAAAIASFNEFLAAQQKLTVDECLLAIAAFNHKPRIMQMMVPIVNIPPLSTQTYIPSGSTALFDAISYTVKEIERGIQPDDRIVCVILTDGEENASRETTLQQVKDLIAAKEATGRWSFVYLSASPDAFADGAKMGIAAGNTAYWVGDAGGVAMAAGGMSASIGNYRQSGRSHSNTMAVNIGRTGGHFGSTAGSGGSGGVHQGGTSSGVQQSHDDMWDNKTSA
jgi:uncharacterized protein YegL